MEYKKKRGMLIRHTVNKPLLWSLVVPIAIVDIFAVFYNHTGFRICGIPRVKRANYVRIDRHKLQYLTLWQKFGCLYCGYANGVLQYCVETGARLETYWCGIQHVQDDNFIAPPHHQNYAAYGDEDEFNEKYGD
jgi:hypothetical protein